MSIALPPRARSQLRSERSLRQPRLGRKASSRSLAAANSMTLLPANQKASQPGQSRLILPSSRIPPSRFGANSSQKRWRSSYSEQSRPAAPRRLGIHACLSSHESRYPRKTQPHLNDISMERTLVVRRIFSNMNVFLLGVRTDRNCPALYSFTLGGASP